MKNKRILCAVTALILLVGLLSGCNTMTPGVPEPGLHETPNLQASPESVSPDASAPDVPTPDTSAPDTASVPPDVSPSASDIPTPNVPTPVSPSPSAETPTPDANTPPPSPQATPSPSAAPQTPGSQTQTPQTSPVPPASPTVLPDPTTPLVPSTPAKLASPSPSPKPPASPYPIKKIPAFTSDIIAGTTSEIEIGCRNNGYIKVRCTSEKKIVIQLLYETDKGKLDNHIGVASDWVSIPLTFGNGNYTVRVMENTRDNLYKQIQTTDIQIKLTSSFAPYLVPSYQVNYSTGGKAAKKASELASGLDSDLARAEAIFKYIVENYKYDNDRAKEVRAGNLKGYIPVVDSVFDAKKGICYDYSALYASMLRAVGIPTRMIIGVIPEGKHAWNEVYISGVGWIKINGEFYFDGKKYTRMDSTWAAANTKGQYDEYFKKDSNYVTETIF